MPRTPTRRDVLSAATAAVSVPLALKGPRRSAGPNLILILTDDQRYDALGCRGHPFLKTPSIDRLASEGALGLNAFVTTALCSPSRATILSGQYAHSHGVLDNETLLPPGLPTLPALLRAAGYETAYVGKWHMGGSTDEPRPGFDHWVSFRGQGVYFDPTFNVNGARAKAPGYVTDLLTDHALEWIGRERTRPFFLMLGHKASHSEFQPAPRHAGLFADVPVPVPTEDSEAGHRNAPRWVRAQRNSFHGVDGMYDGKMAFEDFYRNYHRCLLAVDEGVGRILELLDSRKLSRDTLVVFASDNGFLHGEHGLIDKRCMYEESIRIPLLARWEGVIPAGRRVEGMLLNLDIPATFLEAAGLPPAPTIQGRSFLHLLRGQPMDWRGSFLYEYFFERSFPQTPSVLGIRTPSWKLMRFHGIWDRDELYDLGADPKELRNLISDLEAAPRLRELDAELRRLVAETGGRWNPSWTR